MTLLVLSNNGVEHIEEGVLSLLQDLETFKAGNNRLETVPLDISRLTSLVEIDLHDNRISKSRPTF